ncbi:MAG: ATP-binding protein [Pseudomonadota bacterium]
MMSEHPKSISPVGVFDTADGVDEASGDFQWRTLGALSAFRLLIAVLLMAAFASSSSPRFFGELFPQLFVISLLSWFVAGVVAAYATSKRALSATTLTELVLVFDIVAITSLSTASGGAASGIAGLLIVFNASGGFILSRLSGRFMAALATLGVLGSQVYLNVIGEADLLQYPAAGLLCALIFAVVLAVAPVARRLAASEALARRQNIDIANLAELNRYVVQQLREAIIVIDPADDILLVNDAAARHLGVARSEAKGLLSDYSTTLAAYVRSWRNTQTIEDVGEQTTIPSSDGARLQVHIAPFGDASGSGDAALLLFLEDISVLAERVQQSKLASLGRLSASIAHEIRNPIGAMSHAAQLLNETTQDEGHQKLAGIIERNAVRVSNLVDDILQMSRRGKSRPQKLVLGQWLSEFCHEYIQTADLAAGTLALAGEEAIMEIIFDPAHLRQVMLNLVDNACLHGNASVDKPVRFQWGRVSGSRRPYLEVIDYGPGIDEANHARIFEPFFTQHDDGTGLGLYLCQELCELNRATINYRRGQTGGSVLQIVFADPSRWSGVG